MPVFVYRATNGESKVIHGTVLADSARQARDVLRQRNLEIDSLQEKHPSMPVSRGFTFRRFWQPKYRLQVSSFFRELGTLLSVGIPLVDGLDILLTQLRGGFRSLMLEIRELVASGASLSNALDRFPQVFDSFCVSMTEVGENAGNLDSCLTQLATFRTDRDQLKDRVLTSLLYPAIVAFITLGVTIFLMTVVVPTLLQNLEELGRPLPMPTKILKAISDFLLGYGLGLTFSFLVITTLVVFWGSTEKGKKLYCRWLLRLPILGRLIQKQNCSRVALFVGTLTQSGLDPLRAFEIASGAISNPLYRAALRETSDAVARGQDFSAAFAPHESLFPQTIVQLFTLGQNSGQLDTMLLRLARDLDQETSMLAGRISTLVEPCLIIGLGIIVGFVLLATMLPILEAGNVV